jgi:hypothetical protein
MKLEFSWQIFNKFSNVKFNENPFSGSRVVPFGQTDGQTDKHNEAKSRSSQFRDAPKNVMTCVNTHLLPYQNSVSLSISSN